MALATVDLSPRIGTEIKADIEGMGMPEGRMILAKLRYWATQPQFVFKHEWKIGDLLIWDNSGTMHRVDEYPLEDGRMLHRTTIEAKEELVGG